MEDRESLAQYLIKLAADLKDGRSIRSVLDDLESALEEWKEEFPEE